MHLLGHLNLVIFKKSLKSTPCNHQRQTKAGNICYCFFRQPGVKCCLEVLGFKPQPSDSQPDAMTIGYLLPKDQELLNTCNFAS